jgi:kinesin family protein C2/C3
VPREVKDTVNSSNTDTCSLLSSAADVFADTAPVVVSVLDGYNVCIFAYGQTGTGKTFTMEGYQGNRGVNYRTLGELFNVASQRRGEVKYEISVSVMEVYNEQIRDLLAPPLPQDQAPKK